MVLIIGSKHMTVKYQNVVLDIIISPISTSKIPETINIELDQKQRHIEYFNSKSRDRWNNKYR